MAGDCVWALWWLTASWLWYESLLKETVSRPTKIRKKSAKERERRVDWFLMLVFRGSIELVFVSVVTALIWFLCFPVLVVYRDTQFFTPPFFFCSPPDFMYNVHLILIFRSVYFCSFCYQCHHHLEYILEHVVAYLFVVQCCTALYSIRTISPSP